MGYISQDLSYHSNQMTPYTILRPNNLPPEIISEIRRRDLRLDIVVLTMAKFQKTYQSVFEKINE